MHARRFIALGFLAGVLTVGCSSGGGGDDSAPAPLDPTSGGTMAETGEQAAGPDAGPEPGTPAGGDTSGELAVAPGDAAALDASRRWTIGPASFEVDSDIATAQQFSEGTVVVVVGTSGFDRSNGPYSGANVAVTLSDAGSGDYTPTEATNLHGAPVQTSISTSRP